MIINKINYPISSVKPPSQKVSFTNAIRKPTDIKLNNSNVITNPFELSFTATAQYNQARLLLDNELYPGFNKEDVYYIKSLMKKCHYGRDPKTLLEKCKLKISDEKIIIEDFYFQQTDTDSIYYGMCSELIYFIGKDLKQTLGDKYNFYVVYGHSPKYFTPKLGPHFFMLAIPKKYDTLDNPKGVLLPKENDFPPDSLLIDPSFGIVDQAKNCNDYAIRQLYKLEDYYPFLIKSQELNYYKDTKGRIVSDNTILGYLKDLMPLDAKLKEYKESMVFMMFIKQNPPSPRLVIQKGPHDYGIELCNCKNLIIPKDSLLWKIYSKFRDECKQYKS